MSEASKYQTPIRASSPKSIIRSSISSRQCTFKTSVSTFNNINLKQRLLNQQIENAYYQTNSARSPNKAHKTANSSRISITTSNVKRHPANIKRSIKKISFLISGRSRMVNFDTEILKRPKKCEETSSVSVSPLKMQDRSLVRVIPNKSLFIIDELKKKIFKGVQKIDKRIIKQKNGKPVISL